MRSRRAARPAVRVVGHKKTRDSEREMGRDEAVRWINARYAAANVSHRGLSRFMILEDVEGGGVRIIAKTSFRQWLSNRRVAGYPLYDVWLNHPERRWAGSHAIEDVREARSIAELEARDARNRQRLRD